MRSLIIHNLDAGFGSNSIFQFERELLGYGDECVMRTLARGVNAGEALTDAEDFDLVVISGGDGTAANALYALRGREIPTCVFPSGTENLLFTNLGNALEPKVIASACKALETARLDLGELHLDGASGERSSRCFSIMAGMGFDARVMKTGAENKKSLGDASYIAAVLSNLNPIVADFKICVDGETHIRQGISCIVANAATMQGDINMLPGCRMDDGLLDVMVLATTDAVGLLLPLFAGIIDPLGSLFGRPHIERFTGKEIRIDASVPLPFQCDGSVLDSELTSFEASCLPASSLVVVDNSSPYHKD